MGHGHGWSSARDGVMRRTTRPRRAHVAPAPPHHLGAMTYAIVRSVHAMHTCVDAWMRTSALFAHTMDTGR
eukprot:scaffold9162_cov108-Isochrysis_galbana.AAC.1